MNNFLLQTFSFFFWPNPGNASYGSPKAMALLIFCVLLVALAVVISFWRRRLKNQVTKKLSRSWGSASFWFGFTGLILVIARVEQIQYIAMRVWWVAWVAAAILYVWFQIRLFRARHYEVIPTQTVADPRSKYLPKQKKR
ncbi:MAG TPA: hypothetical protein VHA78_03520 [Candidatus Peribacteraceae bacterium]|nr:hypothetical protein [Candidatus Peribacteraceae bacterium]